MEDVYLADLLFMFVLIAIVGLVITRRQRMGSGKAQQAQAKDPAKENTVSEAKRRAQNPEQIVEDVRMTQTSRIVDAIQILDDLGSSNPGYRHYCELVGQSQATGGVTAPYSQRQVAYYDLRCYRIEVREGRDVETLVAHERSIDPFYFRDAASDDRVYVDLDSFGTHCILVNSTNRVEGPNSDFAKKLSSVIGAAKQQSATGVPGVMAAVRDAVRRGGNVLQGARAGVEATATALAGGMQPAYAGASAGLVSAGQSVSAPEKGGNLQFAGFGRPNGMPGGQRPGFGGPRPGSQQFHGQTGQRPGQFGQGFPNDLNIFLGSYPNTGHLGGPYYYKNDMNTAMETLVGMSLGALVGSLMQSGTSHTTTHTSSPYGTGRPDPTSVSQVNGFRGYRIIEDVVPLNSPIYALGEIYRNGPDVFIGRSVAAEYPSSYFATKPEAEVIAALS